VTEMVVTCDNVTRRFAIPIRRGLRTEVTALDSVSLEIPQGQLVALAGPSGSGKSTLLAIIGALDLPTTGTIRVNGQQVAELTRRERRRFRQLTAVTMMPQPADNLLLDHTGRENVVLAARQRGVDGDLAAMADEALDQLQLGSFADQQCAEMSGGEQQRIALAACLMGGARIVLADEPSGALDSNGAATIIDTLLAAATSGMTIVAATHDPNIIAAATTVIRLDHGRRVE